MSNGWILGVIAGVACLLYVAGRYFGRWKFFRGRNLSTLAEIVEELPENDRACAEEILRALGKSFGVQAECLRLNDLLSELYAMDSWLLGKGEEELQQWLRVYGIMSLKNTPTTIRDLIVLVAEVRRCTELQ